LVFAGPGIPEQVRNSAPTTLLDLPATLLEFAGAAPLPDADSQSLHPVLTTGAQGRSQVFAALNDWQAVIADCHKLIEYDDGNQLLFDLVSDPTESHNLATANPNIVSRLHALLHPKHPPPRPHE
jgi:arylsulfatase A-like enzyme